MLWSTVERSRRQKHAWFFCALRSAIKIAFTCSMSVGQMNAGDRQWNAEVDHPPWICMRQGVHTAVVWQISLAATIDRIAGRVKAALEMHAHLSGRLVDRHVTHLIQRVRVRWTHPNTQPRSLHFGGNAEPSTVSKLYIGASVRITKMLMGAAFASEASQKNPFPRGCRSTWPFPAWLFPAWPLLYGDSVRPNLLNMPKSASAHSCWMNEWMKMRGF